MKMNKKRQGDDSCEALAQRSVRHSRLRTESVGFAPTLALIVQSGNSDDLFEKTVEAKSCKSRAPTTCFPGGESCSPGVTRYPSARLSHVRCT